MDMAKKKKKDPLWEIKLEIARELGLSDKLEKRGWKGMTARETGRIGGSLSAKRRQAGK
jgi:small acid-soluble spore protein F (minor alpha/beta-type SASP)